MSATLQRSCLRQRGPGCSSTSCHPTPPTLICVADVALRACRGCSCCCCHCAAAVRPSHVPCWLCPVAPLSRPTTWRRRGWTPPYGWVSTASTALPHAACGRGPVLSFPLHCPPQPHTLSACHMCAAGGGTRLQHLCPTHVRGCTACALSLMLATVLCVCVCGKPVQSASLDTCMQCACALLLKPLRCCCCCDRHAQMLESLDIQPGDR